MSAGPMHAARRGQLSGGRVSRRPRYTTPSHPALHFVAVPLQKPPPCPALLPPPPPTTATTTPPPLPRNSATRRKYGLLEKKGDYLLRARDFQHKQATLNTLRRKAEERNPDEFYFAMEQAGTRDGVAIARSSQPNRYSQEELQLMRTQDVGYLTLKAQTEAKVGRGGRGGRERCALLGLVCVCVCVGGEIGRAHV